MPKKMLIELSRTNRLMTELLPVTWSGVPQRDGEHEDQPDDDDEQVEHEHRAHQDPLS